jgi:hypothetical protein
MKRAADHANSVVGILEAAIHAWIHGSGDGKTDLKPAKPLKNQAVPWIQANQGLEGQAHEGPIP